ncbi:hypothetical protein B0A50_08122 [Salinomyces thailandicus]|uniref:Nitrogen permease regulator 3 n=1 Tax=Salinomyces thailandicus TaxID=706561 RepID=A0A4U0TK54_9PEZI|nr:hypothetical protein B0A50_08122 [Salinomyces thailandica]
MDPVSHVKSTRGLVAILLVTRSRPGPKLVFHYPTQPDRFANASRDGQQDDSDSDLESDDDDEASIRRKTRFHTGSKDQHEASDGLEDPPPSNGHRPETERILGHSLESLEKLLSPGRWSDRKKFEVCLDGLTFVGHPVHASQEGNWTLRSHEERFDRGGYGDDEEEQAVSSTRAKRASANSSDPVPEANVADITITEPEPMGKGERDFTHIADSFESKGVASLGTSYNSASTASGIVTEQIQMFHVVFVLGPESQQQAMVVYESFAKKLSRALLYCQRQSSYVATESRKMLALKAKAKQAEMAGKELPIRTVEHSELAWALKEVYESFSTGAVARIRLNGMQMSLQPPASHTSDDNDSEPRTPGPHNALLLLEDKESLLRQLPPTETASPLAYFLREHTPTKTLQKHATTLSLPFTDLIYLSQHLLQWRKARLLPTPLHPRNLYTTRPEAPVERIPELAAVYARQFPGLPPLPQMLKMLSGRPMQYGVLIPSREHRAAYMEILAFLVGEGFVVQLKTHGWLRAPPSGEEKVEQDGIGLDGWREEAGSRGSELSSAAEEDEPHEPHSRPDAATIKPLPIDSNHPQHRIILDPTDPSPDNTALLDAVREALEGTEVSENLELLLPYLDGKHVLEEVAAREGVKRALVGEWLGVLGSRGCLDGFRCV